MYQGCRISVTVGLVYIFKNAALFAAAMLEGEVLVNTLAKRASVLMAAMAMLTGGAAVARADQQVTATVPFVFQVGEMTLPAGVYTISYRSEQPNLLTITAASGEHVTIALAVRLSNEALADGPRLEFRRTAGANYLERVVLSDVDGMQMSLPALAAASRSR
ncbi:MAG TPA: hypothetical protein VGI12_01595 [Vicinamibacterales bacterium]